VDSETPTQLKEYTDSILIVLIMFMSITVVYNNIASREQDP